MMEFNCIEDGHVGLEALPKLVSASSCMAFTNKALVAKANKFPRIAPLSSLGLLDPGNRLLRMLFQNGNLLEFLENAEKDPSGKEVVALAKEEEPPKALELSCVPEEVLDSLPSNFFKFSRLLGLHVEGFEKEISSLLQKLE